MIQCSTACLFSLELDFKLFEGRSYNVFPFRIPHRAEHKAGQSHAQASNDGTCPQADRMSESQVHLQLSQWITYPRVRGKSNVVKPVFEEVSENILIYSRG